MRRLIVLGLLLIPWRNAFASFVVLSPSTATVFVGGTVQFSSTESVTWSLAAGSSGTISAGGLYTAPTTYFTAKNVMDGCMLMPNDHIFNTRIDNLPVDSNSATRVANEVASHLAFEVDFPHNILNNNTPTTNMVFRYTANNNGPFPLLSWPYRGEEASNLSSDPLTQDHHILGVSTDTCKFYDMYQNGPIGYDSAAPTTNSQSGVSYFGTQYALPDVTAGGGGGADAAGLYLQPLALRYSELQAGVINHALRFTMNNGNIYSGFLWPAVASTNECSNFANCIPYGSRLRLKAAYHISATDSKATKAIKNALKNYGMFMADGGTANRIQTMADATLDTTTWNSLWSEIPNISSMSQTDFEQVDESTLMESTSSGHVNLSNAFVTPTNYARAIATKISDGTTGAVNVALQAVTVGALDIPYPANSGSLSVMAGTPQFQIPFWVQGATDTGATCTMSPSSGTLTTGCLYTPPTVQTNAIFIGTVTITANKSDPNATYSFPLTIFPSDAMRLRSGPKSSANAPSPTYDASGNLTDAAGNIWWNDPTGSNPNWYESDDQFSPQANWGGATDINLYYTRKFGSSDKPYAAMVPNGNYTLTIGFGTTDPADIAASTATLDSQGVVLISTVSIVHTTYTPNTLSYPITVTNNQFYWAIRGISPTSHDMLSNWKLVFNSPLSTTTHIKQGGRKMTGGQQSK